MRHFFSNKRLIILLISIIVLVAMIGFTMKERSTLSKPEQFFKDSVAFVQSIFYKPAKAVAGFFENISDLKNMYDENKVLKARLDEYAKLKVDYEDIKKENDELKELVGKKDSLREYNIISASVIARSPDRWNNRITIDKGSEDGVETNMAVMTPAGLIGKVKNAQPFSSTVQLISDVDRTNRVSAFVQDKHDIFGVIDGYDPEKKALLFNNIRIDIEVKKGAKVVTSGLGGVFPSNLMIGEIIEVKNDKYGLTQSALVKPSADLYDINNVMIVKRKAEVITDGQEKEEER
ncbi:rod shape-determining protein MreC [Pueribacillus theae]|uniref:Cell shape-determining protein MreC n=1 Tax=Pueribacillus theae TaxID=2171751 RepID=A0A2U1K0K6_9BACI|nr:rod shape-determining protein MreC [Pueribacillus theae]PWA10709.1 rod shape-determining protein MreC [Pueribacillus theae]